MAFPGILVLGPLPPPATGMTLMTQRIVGRLKELVPVEVINYSPSPSPGHALFHLGRFLRGMLGVVKLILRGRVKNAPLYLVGNAARGLYVTALTVFFARRLGYRIYLHHHVYSYISEYDWRMGWIDRSMRGSGVHIVACEKMREDFTQRYGSTCRFIYLSPSIMDVQIGQPRLASSRPFRLGHLSNLTIEKGLDAVLETFRKLVAAGRQVQLDLAGPVTSPPAQRLLEQALAEHPEAIRYLGPMYGADKLRFYSNIDAFLFPTRYRNESWGIVLYESMSAGAPAITFDRGCTATVIGDGGGLVVPQGGDYVTAACEQIGAWIDNEDCYRAASVAAVKQAGDLQALGHKELDEFAEQLSSSHKAAPAKSA